MKLTIWTCTALLFLSITDAQAVTYCKKSNGDVFGVVCECRPQEANCGSNGGRCSGAVVCGALGATAYGSAVGGTPAKGGSNGAGSGAAGSAGANGGG